MFWGFFMFKNWEECKLITLHLAKKMKDSTTTKLIKRVKFAEELSTGRRYFVFNHLRIACTESGIWDGEVGFRTWLKNEIKEMNDMIEYYKVNMNGRTV